MAGKYDILSERRKFFGQWPKRKRSDALCIAAYKKCIALERTNDEKQMASVSRRQGDAVRAGVRAAYDSAERGDDVA